MSILHT